MGSVREYREIARLRRQCQRYDEEPMRECYPTLETLSLDDAVYPYGRFWSPIVEVGHHRGGLSLTKFVEMIECMRKRPLLRNAKPLLRIEGGFDLGYGRELRLLCSHFPYVPIWSGLQDASYETIIDGLKPIMHKEAIMPGHNRMGGIPLQVRGPFSYRILVEALDALRSCGFWINCRGPLAQAQALWCVGLALPRVPEELKKAIVAYLL